MTRGWSGGPQLRRRRTRCTSVSPRAADRPCQTPSERWSSSAVARPSAPASTSLPREHHQKCSRSSGRPPTHPSARNSTGIEPPRPDQAVSASASDRICRRSCAASAGSSSSRIPTFGKLVKEIQTRFLVPELRAVPVAGSCHLSRMALEQSPASKIELNQPKRRRLRRKGDQSERLAESVPSEMERFLVAMDKTIKKL